jgi:hypothetical protein
MDERGPWTGHLTKQRQEPSSVVTLESVDFTDAKVVWRVRGHGAARSGETGRRLGNWRRRSRKRSKRCFRNTHRADGGCKSGLVHPPTATTLGSPRSTLGSAFTRAVNHQPSATKPRQGQPKVYS